VPSQRHRPETARLLGFGLLLALALLLAVAALGFSAPGAGAKGVRKLADARAVGRLSCAQARRNLIAHRSRRSRLRRRSAARRLKSCSTPRSSGGPLYWGAWVGNQLTGTEAPWDMGAVSKFEAMTGKSAALINFSSPFADCSKSPCSFYDFPQEEMERIRQHGSIPFFSWGSQATPASLNEPDFQLSDVIAGRYDSYIRSWAEAAREWGHPFFLRFNWEMNGNWFQWSEGVNGNQAGEYVAAWRHVHDIFASVGATNATWTWCPNIDPNDKLHDLASLYPGDEYVDWTSLDGYNWGASPSRPEKWRSFGELFGPTYDAITERIAPAKPMIIGEVGSTEYGGSKAEWISDMLQEIPAEFPRIRGLQWFEKSEEGDWPIESSQASAAAFAQGIQNPIYVGNSYASVAGTIQPPS
jgi:beta-mannanase